jgi:endonuclease/exonuclease/phosphatase family metal-dependent hydrolase
MLVSVLQWNIWCNEDIRHTAQVLKEQNADIVCLQELTINYKAQTIKDTPAYIAEQLGYNYHYKELPIMSTDGDALTFTNGIFSRFPIINKRFVWTNEPRGSGGYDDEYRAYVEITLDVNGKKVSVGTTHMSYTDRFEITPNKRYETDRLVEELATHKDRFIFAGDLNATPDSYTVQAVKKHLQDAGPPADEKTWTTKPFSYNGFEEHDLNWRLDYVFTTKDLHVASCQTISTEYSDHLPLKATIEL